MSTTTKCDCPYCGKQTTSNVYFVIALVGLIMFMMYDREHKMLAGGNTQIKNQISLR